MAVEAFYESSEAVYQRRRFRRIGRSSLRHLVAERDELVARLREELGAAEARVAAVQRELRAASQEASSARSLAERREARVVELEALGLREASLTVELAEVKEALRQQKAAARERGELESTLRALRAERDAAVEEGIELRRELEALHAGTPGAEAEIGSASEKLVQRLLEEELRGMLEAARDAAARLLATARAEIDRLAEALSPPALEPPRALALPEDDAGTSEEEVEGAAQPR